jgi:hypothetical protein
MTQPIEATSNVAAINEEFSDDRIARLLRDQKIAFKGDFEKFTNGVRTAVDIYQRDRLELDQNDQFREVENLFKKARRLHEVQVETKKQMSYPSTRSNAKKIESYKTKAEAKAIELSLALSQLSSITISRLNNRGEQQSEKIQLPSPDEVTNSETYDNICDRIFALCSIGRRREHGRDRGKGKQSTTIKIEYYAPKPTRHPQKREAEITFIMWVQVAWTEATGSLPSLGASYERQGPFVRLITEFFHWLGVNEASPVELINKLNAQRNMKSSRKSDVS